MDVAGATAAAWVREAFDNAAVGMALVDLDGRYLRVNERFRAMLARPLEQILGRTTSELSHPDDAERGRRALAAVASGEVGSDEQAKRFLRPDGSVVHVLRLTRLVRDEEGRPAFLFTQYVDVTDRTVRAHGLAELGAHALAGASGEQLRAQAERLVATALRLTPAEGARLLDAATAGHRSAGGPLDDQADFVRSVANLLRGAQARRRAEETVRHQALHDTLTGLPNRTMLDLALDRRHGASALVLVDLDEFRDVNDTVGHAVGDELLRAVADRIRASLRPEDLVVRLGGDEFAVLCEVGDVGVARRIAGRLLAALETPVWVAGRAVRVRASAGVAWTPDGDLEQLLADADLAMYAAKAGGGHRVETFRDELRAAVTERLALEHDLREAVAGRRLEVHYQPVVDLSTGRWVGLESLLRWTDPGRGPVPPDVFVPLAEQSGLLGPLGRWGIRTALTEFAGWRRLRPADPPPWVSVNLSAGQLRDRRLLDTVVTAVEDLALPEGSVVAEVTETVLVGHDEGVEALERLRAHGLRVALDDFGTGHSSLSYLVRFPVDIVKVDRSFVVGLVDGAKERAVLRALVGLTRDLGMVLVAEGIEDEAQADMLQRLGCGLGQGYRYARPMPADQVRARLGADG